MNANQNYALIDNASGFVWYVGSAESPESVCTIATLETGGDRFDYTPAYQLASNESGYMVYAAPVDFSVNDGQDEAEIAAVEALEFIGKFRKNV